jgi:hypothetical protein
MADRFERLLFAQLVEQWVAIHRRINAEVALGRGLVIADNPKDADATLSVESVVNGHQSPGITNYTSSAELTAKNGTLLWSDSVGDGSKFMDAMVGETPKISAEPLLAIASKAVCK